MLAPLKVHKASFFKQGYSLGAYVHHELLGKLGAATEVEVPVTVEMLRHYQWKTALRPYLGLGAGGFYRKTYRTGSDIRSINPGVYVALGANAPIQKGQLLGFDVRIIRLNTENDPVNPVFGAGGSKSRHQAPLPSGRPRNPGALHWSAKINFTMTYSGCRTALGARIRHVHAPLRVWVRRGGKIPALRELPVDELEHLEGKQQPGGEHDGEHRGVGPRQGRQHHRHHSEVCAQEPQDQHRAPLREPQPQQAVMDVRRVGPEDRAAAHQTAQEREQAVGDRERQGNQRKEQRHGGGA